MGNRFVKVEDCAAYGGPENLTFQFFVALLSEKVLQHLHLVGLKGSRNDTAKDIFESLFICFGFSNHSCGHGLGGFHKHLVVEQRESLQRTIGDVASGQARLARRRIKCGSHGKWCRSFHERVETASIAIFTIARLPLDLAIGALGGDAGGLGRVNAWAAHF